MTTPAPTVQEDPLAAKKRIYFGTLDVTKTGVYHVRDIDEHCSTYRWCVDNISQVPNRTYSAPFTIDGLEWRLFLFPTGNNVTSLSVYLDVGDVTNYPPDWCRFAKFRLGILNQNDLAKSITQDAEKRYSPGDVDWGFRELIPAATLNAVDGGFKVNDRIILEVTVRVYREEYLLSKSYDSRLHTGYLPASSNSKSYMAQMLQTLYLLTAFRRTQYRTHYDAQAKALQKIFWNLQFDTHPVDISEYINLLSGTPNHEAMIYEFTHLFRGDRLSMIESVLTNRISCCDVDFEVVTQVPATMIDISHKVSSLEQGLKEYLGEEIMDGTNKFLALGHGFQKAIRTLRFTRLPPVLAFRLPRFVCLNKETKIWTMFSDRLEFPQTIDMEEYLDEKAPQKGTDNQYELFSVIVHSGTGEGTLAEFSAFIKPLANDDKWYTFDSTRVFETTEEDVFISANGGDSDVAEFTKYKNYKTKKACFLMYLRKSEMEELLAPLKECDLPPSENCEIYEKEKMQRQKEREEAEYCYIRIATNQIMSYYTRFDLVNFSDIQPIRIKRKAKIIDLKNEIARIHHVPIQRQRFWKWERRQNKSYRPDVVLTPMDSDDIDTAFNIRPKEEHFDCYLEILDSTVPTSPSFLSHCLLFFKCFDPVSQRLWVSGSIIADQDALTSTLIPHMLKSANLDSETPIEVFEEIRSNMIDPVNMEVTIRAAELQNGDILVFQSKPACNASTWFKCCREYYEYIRRFMNIRLKSMKPSSVEVCMLALDRDMTYEQVLESVADVLNVDDQSKLKLYGEVDDEPANEPFAPGSHLRTMLPPSLVYTHDPSVPNTIFFDIVE